MEITPIQHNLLQHGALQDRTAIMKTGLALTFTIGNAVAVLHLLKPKVVSSINSQTV